MPTSQPNRAKGVMILQLGVLLLSFLFVGQVQAQEARQMNMEILKVKADKKLLVASNMNLTDEEAKSFWPLYDGYQKELEQINQRLGATINTKPAPITREKGKSPTTRPSRS